MIVLYATGHGFGHATRQAALCEELLRRRPGLALEVRTTAPAWIFTERCPVKVTAGGADAGMLQKDSLDLDLDATLRANLAIDADWPRLVAEEAAWLKSRGARLVVGDIPPLAFEAAHAAGLPSVAVGNFCWDWIFQPYAAADARWEPARRRCELAYSRARKAYRLPLSGDFPAFKAVEDAPLLCRKAGRALDRPQGKPLILAAFGGFGQPLALAAGEDLSRFDFAGFGPKPAGLNARWRPLDNGEQLPAMAACDAVLSKPGYGIISEAMAHGKRLLYVPRQGFREIGPLTAGIDAWGGGAALQREDLLAGRWGAALDALLSRPAPAPVPADGASWLAERLLG